jgi:hypothetical protein
MVKRKIHVVVLLNLPRLRSIQWVTGYGKSPFEDWLPLLKKIKEA